MKRTVFFEGQWHAGSINRPYLVRWWHDRRDWGLYVQWGNRNSDPVWSIGFNRFAHEPTFKPCIPVTCPPETEADIGGWFTRCDQADRPCSMDRTDS